MRKIRKRVKEIEAQGKYMTANALTTAVQHAYEPLTRCNMLLRFYEVTPDVWYFTYRVFKMKKKRAIAFASTD